MGRITQLGKEKYVYRFLVLRSERMRSVERLGIGVLLWYQWNILARTGFVYSF
jgi:hypothetical protein